VSPVISDLWDERTRDLRRIAMLEVPQRGILALLETNRWVTRALELLLASIGSPPAAVQLIDPRQVQD
jgi:hypothetical protein